MRGLAGSGGGVAVELGAGRMGLQGAAGLCLQSACRVLAGCCCGA